MKRWKGRKGRACRGMAFLLAGTLLFLSACQPSVEEYTPPAASMQPQEEWGRQEVALFLHYFDELGNEKTAPVTIVREKEESRAMLAAMALFESGEEARWGSVPEDWQPLFIASERNVQVESVAVSGNTANVSLRSVDGGSVDLSTRVKSRVYLANTLIDTIPEVEYVNVFYNGKPLKYNNMALGAMGRYESSPDEYLEELKRRSDQAYPMTINATLYFPHESGEYLVCETRPIEMTDGLGRAVMADLLRGPSTPGLKSITSGGIMAMEDSFQMVETLGPQRDGEGSPLLEETALALDGDETDEMELSGAGESEENAPSADVVVGEETAAEGGLFSSFEQMLSIRVQGTADNPALSQAAVVCTMLTLQDKDGAAVIFPQDDYGSEDVYMNQDDFGGVLGNWIDAYAYTDGDFLIPARSVGPQDQVGVSPALTLAALWDVAGEASEGAVMWPVFSGAWREDMLKSVEIAGNLAIVDLKGQAFSIWQELPAKDLRLQVYGIVNSLSELYGINSVQILIDGEVPGMVGDISLASPLMANPGILHP